MARARLVSILLKIYVLRLVGFVLWLGYGAALGSVPLIFFTVLNLVLGGAILVFKLQAIGICRDRRGRFCQQGAGPA
jgi:uncharacterized protein with PQ loop repeat